MIAFKRTSSLDEWVNLHPRLREILLWLHPLWPASTMIITRIAFPPVEGESGVHQTTPHRACDLSTHDLSPSEGSRMERFINSHWVYSSGARQVAVYHQIPGGALHMHLQVRDETQARVPSTDT